MTKPAPAKTPDQSAFEAAQAQIRACVAAPADAAFFTWYRTGSVTRWTRGTQEVEISITFNLYAFNSILERNGVRGLQMRGAGKCPEWLEGKEDV